MIAVVGFMLVSNGVFDNGSKEVESMISRIEPQLVVVLSLLDLNFVFPFSYLKEVDELIEKLAAISVGVNIILFSVLRNDALISCNYPPQHVVLC